MVSGQRWFGNEKPEPRPSGLRVSSLRASVASLGLVALLAVACGTNDSALPVDEIPSDMISLSGEVAAAAASARDDVAKIKAELGNTGIDYWRSCMTAAGFDFPQVSAEIEISGSEFDGLTEVEFARQYGFGVSTLANDSQPSAQTPPEALIYQYAQSLPPNEQEPYVDAFLGNSTLPFMSGFEPTDTGGASVDPDSCFGRGQTAQKEFLATNYPDFTEREAVAAAAADIAAAFEADPEIVEIYKSYGECMREAGYDVQPPSPTGAALLAVSNYSEFLRGQQTGEATSSASIEAEEIQLALQSLSCQAPLRPELLTLYNEFEGEWLENHPTLIPLLAEYGS